MSNEIGEMVRGRPGTALAAGLAASVALLAACSNGDTRVSAAPKDHTRDTVVCGRGTYVSPLTVDKDGAFSPAPGAFRTAYLDLPGGEQATLYDPEHKAGSLANRGRQDRTDPADRNSDAVAGLGGEFRLSINPTGEVTDVQLLKTLTADQVNAACGHMVMSVVPAENQPSYQARPDVH